MPRAVTTAFKNAAKAKTLEPLALFEGLFDTGALRLWTGIGDLSWNGFTWTGGAGVIGFEPVEETLETQSNGTKITLSGVDGAIISMALSERYQGRVVNIYLALTDTSTGALVANPDILFSGRADVMTITDSGPTCSVSLAVESRLIDLKRARTRRYEPEDQKLYYPNDKGFDFVPTMQDRNVKWTSRN
jgi:hypothetical protein